MRRPLRSVATVMVIVAAVAACSSDDPKEAAAPPPPAAPLDADRLADLTAELGTHPTCDPLDEAACLLPFPSNQFTKADTATDTGRRIELPAGAFVNAKGASFDPTEWNRNDGFSPGTPVLVSAPSLDVAASALPTQGDLSASLSPGSGSVLVDMDTGRRILHWAELDDRAPSDAERLLALHPAEAFPEGHRIAVGLRGLKDSTGAAIPSSVAFTAYRDNLSTHLVPIEDRRATMEEVFTSLGSAGVERKDLFLAWDFTVASRRNLSERMLAIRDGAFGALGDRAPTFAVTETLTDPAVLEPGIARLVRGTFRVPLYLTGAGEAGSRFNYGTGSDVPAPSGQEFEAAFSCQVPARAVDGAGGTSRPVVYGHGLLGSRKEVENSQVAKNASTNDMTYCATDWIGMSSGDVGNAVDILNDVSRFPTLADRSQQGILNTLFLARLMVRPDGLGSSPAFRNAAGASVLVAGPAYFDGNSQGAIIGGAATAVAQDWTKAVLGVPGMDYALLLSRSVDFSEYFTILQTAYPNRIDQQLLYGVLQMLWDRAETNGYAQHLGRDPYTDTPQHQVLLHVALGDHQVANVAAEYEARTIGAKVRQPALADGRHPDAVPFVGLEAATLPTAESLLVYFDSGTIPAPPGNITPRDGAEWKATCGSMDEEQWSEDARCADPHEDPRRAVAAISQKDQFFRPDGTAADTCEGRPCTAEPRFTLDY